MARQISIEILNENELLPTIKVSKDDLFLKPSANYFVDKIVKKNREDVRMGFCKGFFYHLCCCCLCRSKEKASSDLSKDK